MSRFRSGLEFSEPTWNPRPETAQLSCSPTTLAGFFVQTV